MSEEQQNDSPAFRLRPRRSAPKSYYAVRLEYSANPAAFIRERPRTSSKRKVFSQKAATSNQTRVNQTGQSSRYVNPTKEEQERDDRRKLLRRNISDSITTGTMVSPFLQRLDLEELKPDNLYEHNYVTLMIKKVDAITSGDHHQQQQQQPPHHNHHHHHHHPHHHNHNQEHTRILSCLCQDVDVTDSEKIGKSVHVELFDEYADSSLVTPGKMISIAKFRTSSAQLVGDNGATPGKNDNNNHTDTNSALPFNVIVKFDELSSEQQQQQVTQRSTSNSTTRSSSINHTASCSNMTTINPTALSPARKQPVVPFISITEMIERPIDPYVEMMPSPSSKNGNGMQSRYGNGDNRAADGDHGDENHDTKKLKFTANPPI